MKIFEQDIREELKKIQESTKKASEKTKEELEEEARIVFLASVLEEESETKE